MQTRHTTCFVLAAIIIVMIVPPRAVATDLVFPGIHSQMGAGAGTTVTRGAAAVFHNPANMIYSKFIEPYFDIGMAQATYTYQYTGAEGFDPAVLKSTAMPVTAGLTLRFTPSFTVGGAMATPAPSGTVSNIIGVPIESAPGTATLHDYSSKQLKTWFAGGAAFRLDHYLTVGAGMIMGSEKFQLIVTPQEGEEALIDALYAGSYSQFTGGVRSELFERKVVLGLSYRTAATIPYKGDYLLNTSEEADYEPFEGVGYVPAVIGFGAETRFGDFGVFFDMLMEQWAAGRTVAKGGIGTSPAEVDYVNANNFMGGAKLWFGKHMLTAAVGMHAANIGNGSEATAATAGLQDEATDDGSIAGPGVVDVGAIPRMIAGGGYRYKLQDHGFFEGGASMQTGSRSVPEGFSNPGDRKLSVLTFSGGLAFGF